MKKMTKVLLMALCFTLLGIALAFLTSSPSPASPGPTAVVVTNTATNPALVRDVDNPGREAFALNASCSNPNSCAATAVFPSNTASGAQVQTVVVEFVSAFCNGLPTTITQDNFNFNFTLSGTSDELFFPALVEAGIGRMAQQTRIYADPGSSASLGTPGNNTGCSIGLTGYFVTK